MRCKFVIKLKVHAGAQPGIARKGHALQGDVVVLNGGEPGEFSGRGGVPLRGIDGPVSLGGDELPVLKNKGSLVPGFKERQGNQAVDKHGDRPCRW